MKDLFGGQLRSEVLCGGCGAASTAFDPFLDLSVPIPSGVQVRQPPGGRGGGGSRMWGYHESLAGQE